MSLYRMTKSGLEEVAPTAFATEKIKERSGIQPLLRKNINVLKLKTELLVIAEEYADWQDSKRRIDLLCLGKDASIVVVEIKRVETSARNLGSDELPSPILMARLHGIHADTAHGYFWTAGEPHAYASIIHDIVDPVRLSIPFRSPSTGSGVRTSLGLGFSRRRPDHHGHGSRENLHPRRRVEHARQRHGLA